MQLIVISGMLGVGKTSVVLGFLKILKNMGKKVAIIENDVGTVSVDSEIVRKDGIEVVDLQNGCICCTLKMDLLEGMIKIQNQYDPDVILLEPTGIANPVDLLSVVKEYTELRLKKISVLSVIDAQRFEIMKKVYARPISHHLEIADLVLINKVDAVPREKIPSIEEGIRGFGYEGKIMEICADSGKGLDEAMKVMMQ